MSQIPIDVPPEDRSGSDGPEDGSDPAGGSGQGQEGRPIDDLPVEEQLRRLETIVQKLESEAVSLDESIALFEEGVELAVAVRKRLEFSEGRIKRIVERSEGLFSLEDFDLE
ncbi:MAG: exodeoxyribonuclease VII small subunit [Gemmatimonadota bacterium]